MIIDKEIKQKKASSSMSLYILAFQSRRYEIITKAAMGRQAGQAQCKHNNVFY